MGKVILCHTGLEHNYTKNILGIVEFTFIPSLLTIMPIAAQITLCKLPMPINDNGNKTEISNNDHNSMKFALYFTTVKIIIQPIHTTGPIQQLLLIQKDLIM